MTKRAKIESSQLFFRDNYLKKLYNDSTRSVPAAQKLAAVREDYRKRMPGSVKERAIF